MQKQPQEVSCSAGRGNGHSQAQEQAPKRVSWRTAAPEAEQAARQVNLFRALTNSTGKAEARACGRAPLEHPYRRAERLGQLRQHWLEAATEQLVAGAGQRFQGPLAASSGSGGRVEAACCHEESETTSEAADDPKVPPASSTPKAPQAKALQSAAVAPARPKKKKKADWLIQKKEEELGLFGWMLAQAAGHAKAEEQGMGNSRLRIDKLGLRITAVNKFVFVSLDFYALRMASGQDPYIIPLMEGDELLPLWWELSYVQEFFVSHMRYTLGLLLLHRPQEVFARMPLQALVKMIEVQAAQKRMDLWTIPPGDLAGALQRARALYTEASAEGNNLDQEGLNPLQKLRLIKQGQLVEAESSDDTTAVSDVSDVQAVSLAGHETASCPAPGTLDSEMSMTTHFAWAFQ